MKNLSLTTIHTENHSVVTVIEGDLIIRDAEQLKTEFLSLLNTHQHIDIRFKKIQRLDLAALQLLAALKNSALKQQKTIKYHFEQAEYTDHILRSSGFDTILNID